MRDRTGRALFWTLLDVGGSQGLSFLLYVILTRILTPEDYGVFALSLAITTIVNVVAFQGFSDALIQREVAEEDDRSTAFWTNLALGALLGAGLILAAPLLAKVFGTPALGPVLQAMSSLCLLRALISVQTALCRRELRVAAFAVRAIGGYIVGGAVGIALSLDGWGIWSLVACQIVQAVVVMVVMWTSVRWLPRLRFSRRSFRELAGFSRHFLAASLLTAMADKVDNLVIGLVLDAAAVGHYSLALKVLQAIGLLTMSPLLPLMMPVLARLAGDRAAFRDEYVRLVTGCLVVWLPLVAGLGVLAPALIPVAFGPQWGGAVPVLQAMCLGCATVPLCAFTGQALSALGRPEQFARLAGLQMLVATVAYLLASPFGIVAVGFAWAAVSALLLPLHLRALRRVAQVSFLALPARALRVALAGAGMVVAMLTEQRMLGGAVWVTAVVGAVTYLALIELALLPGYVGRLLRSARTALPAFQRTS